METYHFTKLSALIIMRKLTTIGINLITDSLMGNSFRVAASQSQCMFPMQAPGMASSVHIY